MNSIKTKINKLILRLASLGTLILLMLPANLHANHFRYGTMSWEPIDDNGTIRLKMQNGWTADHSAFNNSSDYNGLWVSGFIGSIKNNYVTINWGDGDTDAVDFKVLSRDNSTNDTITEMGDNSSSSWTVGLTHQYSSTGTYIVYWGSTSRETTENMGSSKPWLNKTTITPYFSSSNTTNTSPVSAVPPRVQVQDNAIFNYQLVATDANNDSLNFRWGTYAEFFASSGTYTKPTGMTLSSSGLVTWDVRDSVLCSGCSQDDVNDENDLWVAVMMVEDLFDNGSVKSYIPVDFFFRTASASNDPPAIIGIPNSTQTVSIGNTKTYTFTATDDSGVAPTLSVLNPPSDNSSIWSTSASTSGGTTTFTISFTPISSMDNATYAVNIRSTDGDGMTKDQSLGIKVTSVSNADPTAPTLVSPANGTAVAKPVTFQWTKSTDADNDAISYSLYFCTDSGFAGCSGITVAANGNLMPPNNQIFQYSLISWPRNLVAAPVYQHISQDLSMIPKWIIMLTAFVLLSGLISFSLKNISHRKLVFMLILMIFFFSLNINSCARSDNSTSEISTSSNDDSDDSDDSSTSASTTFTTNDKTYTTSDVTNNTTYYWKVIASDTKGGSSESATWNFTVQ